MIGCLLCTFRSAHQTPRSDHPINEVKQNNKTLVFACFVRLKVREICRGHGTCGLGPKPSSWTRTLATLCSHTAAPRPKQPLTRVSRPSAVKISKKSLPGLPARSVQTSEGRGCLQEGRLGVPGVLPDIFRTAIFPRK